MPRDFRCPKCRLCLSAGRYHYHSIASGYAGRVLSACSACGTQHAIELAVPDRGPESFPTLKVLIEAAPSGATTKIAQWLARERKIELADALALARELPLVVIENAWPEKAQKVVTELEAHGARVALTTAGSVPNTSFGPVQHDRLLHHRGPAFEPNASEWIIGPDVPGEDVSALACQHCGKTGTLVTEIEENSSCPACKNGALALQAEWVT